MNIKEQQFEPALLITVKEAAAMIGFSKRWLEERIRMKMVPVSRTGPSVRIRRADVEAFAKSGRWPRVPTA